MISVWLGDRSGWTGVRLVELDRSSFVDRSGGSWIGAVVRGSERWFMGRSSGSWVGALVRGSELVLSGSWIVRGSELVLSGSWIGALWFVDRTGSELW